VEWSGSSGFGLAWLVRESLGCHWLCWVWMVRLVFLLGWGLLADERRNQQDEAVQDLLHNDDISLRDWCSIDLWRLRRFGGTFSS